MITDKTRQILLAARASVQVKLSAFKLREIRLATVRTAIVLLKSPNQEG